MYDTEKKITSDSTKIRSDETLLSNKVLEHKAVHHEVMMEQLV